MIDGDVADVWWRPLDLGRAEAEGVEDPLDRELIISEELKAKLTGPLNSSET